MFVSRFRRVPAVAAAVAVAGLVSTGCAAGQIAQTADQKSTIDGINATVSTMDLRIVALQAPPGLRTNYPKGSSAPFKVVFANNARTADRLVDVRTSAATGWAAYSRESDAFTVVERSLTSATAAPSATESATPSGTASGTASDAPSGTSTETPSGTASKSGSESASESSSESATTSASGSPATTAASQPRGVQSVTVPAGGRTGFGTPEATGGLILQGLTRALRPADTINVTFTFANAGSVTVPVTVQVADLGRTKPVGEPESAEEAGE